MDSAEVFKEGVPFRVCGEVVSTGNVGNVSVTIPLSFAERKNPSCELTWS